MIFVERYLVVVDIERLESDVFEEADVVDFGGALSFTLVCIFKLILL